jgi:glutamate-1-semialdehyde 2,1-aminomutase
MSIVPGLILNKKAVISPIAMAESVDYSPGLKTTLSKELYERSKNIIPGGASSHCRCYPTFDPYPIALQRGKGSRVWDLDGNEYVDYCLALGPLILGHGPPSVIRAVAEQLEKGTMFAALVEKELKLAEKFREMVPNAEMVRFSNTGAEATMHAIRIARAYTGRDKIIKFEGHYHGAHDYVLVNCFGAPLGALGSEAAPHKVPSSWGIPSDTLKTVIPLPWNDLDVLEKTLKRYDGEIAAVISEPVMMNIGSVPPEEGYLQGMRELTEEHNVVFILDEIITGFRLAPGGGSGAFWHQGRYRDLWEGSRGGISNLGDRGKEGDHGVRRAGQGSTCRHL